MKLVYSIFITLLFSISLNAQIEITLKSGEEYQGIVLNNSNDSINIRTIHGESLSFQKSNITTITPLFSTIRLINGRVIEGYISKMDDKTITLNSTNILSEPEKIIERKEILDFKISEQNVSDFITFGATFGTPGGFNLNGGYEFGPFGFRAVFGAMPWAEMYGLQANFFYNLYSSRHVETGFSLATGYLSIDDYDYLYLAPMYHLNAYGLFLEFGLGIGTSDYYKNPQILFQLGYIHRFNK